jgi:hypothetical protein
MYSSLRSAMFLLVIVASCCAGAHDQPPNRTLKSENGLVIWWTVASSDANANQIEISDDQGHAVAALRVLRHVREARRVSIYDVSARENLIAIAAVYQSKEGDRQVRPAASLLLFSFEGQLLSAFALDPSHVIRRLVLDDHANIWTLTDHADSNVNPATVPMVVEYTREGAVSRQLLTRNMFPFHASDTRESTAIGAPVMGYDSGVVWFWLPGSTDFVTISTSDGKATMMKTELPKKTGRKEVPLGIARESSGNVVLQVREDDDQRRPEVSSEVAYYRWSPSTQSWSQFRPGTCESGRLIGVSDKGQVYLHNRAGQPSYCVFGAD